VGPAQGRVRPWLPSVNAARAVMRVSECACGVALNANFSLPIGGQFSRIERETLGRTKNGQAHAP